jgi:hypothetical protein
MKLAAEMRRRDAVSIARAQAAASGSSHKIAISADVLMIAAAGRAHHTADRRDRLFETAL